MSCIWVFDGDNTIWDTDALFRDAQLALLNVFVRSGLLRDAESNLCTLRQVDREIMRRMGHAEYDFRVLARSIAYYVSIEPSIDRATAWGLLGRRVSQYPRLAGLAKEAFDEFARGLECIPKLYPESKDVLQELSSWPCSFLFLFSEGKPERINATLKAHALFEDGIFQDIVIGQKTRESFYAIKQRGANLMSEKECASASFFVIGDSMHSDIRLGNQAGFTTVYKPSPFKGVERPTIEEEEPDYTVHELSEIPKKLHHFRGDS